MITDKEKQATLLSPTKKDYYQIWNELLELASKISDRWTPSDTNESDPGIVLLKVLTACADRLNYNIDKNILEAFMPSAAQEESMRKLCDMMGYDMKYYKSATTNVTFYFNGDSEIEFSDQGISGPSLVLPKFTPVTTVDEDLTYLTLDQITFTPGMTTRSVECIEGVLYFCAEENNRIVTINNIDDNNRYYLPITQVAENGLFVYNITDNVLSQTWRQVSNLNTVALGTQCYKFGYDSAEMRPYLQFPDDINNIIGDGLTIAYISTNGINGNINTKALCKFTAPTAWGSEDISSENRTGLQHSADEFTCYNTSAAKNGTDPESLSEAYKGFKHTVGTFDTLVTCRDYMNKIYDMTVSTFDSTPIVSNAIVSDIRDDINRSASICSFNEYGISYVDKPVQAELDGTMVDLINNFDLILYPFKTIYQLNTKAEHDGSFKLDKSVKNSVDVQLADYKTISHKISLPKDNEIALIKNYLKLNAVITTTSRVNPAEQHAILNNIKTALYTAFNLRQLDFGEEIPFDDILETIQNADVRIKNVALDDPILYTRFLTADNNEYDTAVCYPTDGSTQEKAAAEAAIKTMMSPTTLSIYSAETPENKERMLVEWGQTAKQIYNKLALRNILAGRVNLFRYNTEFTPSVTETRSAIDGISLIYPENDNIITSISGQLTLDNIPTNTAATDNITLLDNQYVQFRAPNYKTVVTYPAYVNYYLKLNQTAQQSAVAAVFETLMSFIKSTAANGTSYKSLFATYLTNNYANISTQLLSGSIKATDANLARYGVLFTVNNGTVSVLNTMDGRDCYHFALSEQTFGYWVDFIKGQNRYGIFKSMGADVSRLPGKLVDTGHVKYHEVTAWMTVSDPMIYYYVPRELGSDAVLDGVPANAEYMLQNGEFLCINYTDAVSEANAEAGEATINTTTSVVDKYYGPGTIIKPNMRLVDSASQRNAGKSYSKTSGYSFKLQDGQSLDGMYTLGANETIEIREPVVVQIFDNSESSKVYVYFKLNYEPETKNGEVLLFNEYKDGDVIKYAPRTLEEGEYFWYTDKNKTTLTYCGAGCELFNHTGAQIKKKTDAGEVTVEKISEFGINIIPWIAVTGLTVTKNTDGTLTENSKYIEWREYQYITLGAGDAIQYIDTVGNNTTGDVTSTTTGQLTNSWKTVSEGGARYVLNGEIEELPAIDVGTDSWEVRTRLSINTGASNPQVLHTCALAGTPDSTNTDAVPSCKDTLIIHYAGNQTADTSISSSVDEQLSIKTNYAIDSMADTIQTQFALNTDNYSEEINDFKVKVFVDNQIMLTKSGSQQEPLLLNRMSSYFTNFTFDGSEKGVTYTTLHVAIPAENQYGIIMFYYVSRATEGSDDVVKIATTKSEDRFLANFTDGIQTNSISLVPNTVADADSNNNKLNIIKITSSTDLNIIAGDNADDVLIFSPLRLVDAKQISDGDETVYDTGFDLDVLKYWATTESRADVQLLNDLQEMVPDAEFFYNAVLDNSVALDINTYAGETLATPKIWYDYNNTNNKFVVSEIDTNYLNTGLMFASSSTKNY